MERKYINCIEANTQKKALENFVLYSDFNSTIDKQIASLRNLYNDCPEHWIVENIARSVASLMSVKSDIELAYKRSIEIFDTPFLDESDKYLHHH